MASPFRVALDGDDVRACLEMRTLLLGTHVRVGAASPLRWLRGDGALEAIFEALLASRRPSAKSAVFWTSSAVRASVARTEIVSCPLAAAERARTIFRKLFLVKAHRKTLQSTLRAAFNDVLCPPKTAAPRRQKINFHDVRQLLSNGFESLSCFSSKDGAECASVSVYEDFRVAHSLVGKIIQSLGGVTGADPVDEAFNWASLPPHVQIDVIYQDGGAKLLDGTCLSVDPSLGGVRIHRTWTVCVHAFPPL